ncbi:MAG: 50S ribosomal protein L17 [Deltaproteobacteria bacterium]|nr:50S ribosomal protein L17 [Deltaproteobacteria bacterium]
MKHRVRKKQFGRHTAHRKAMFRNMVTSLIKHERIQTTLTKAKELRTYADKMVTLAKQDSVHARRLAARVVRENEALKKLFAELGPRFKSRQGGYTRIFKLGHRLGDGAPIAIIEYLGFVPKSLQKQQEQEKETTKSQKAKKAKAESPKKTKKPSEKIASSKKS